MTEEKGLLPQLEPAVNKVEKEDKGGLVEKFNFSPFDTETLRERSKVSSPPIGKHNQS